MRAREKRLDRLDKLDIRGYGDMAIECTFIARLGQGPKLKISAAPGPGYLLTRLAVRTGEKPPYCWCPLQSSSVGTELRPIRNGLSGAISRPD
jgi:hypothetical protein